MKLFGCYDRREGMNICTCTCTIDKATCKRELPKYLIIA